MAQSVASSVEVEVTPGFRRVISKYADLAELRSSISLKTARQIKLLVQLAGATDDAIEALEWFYKNQEVPPFIKRARPFSIHFITKYFEAFEEFKDNQESIERNRGTDHKQMIGEYKLSQTYA